MKNHIWILFASVALTLGSCISAAQFNNTEDDVYYSPKASNTKQPVIIPDVDVDEIIRQNPPKYGNPTNRVDDDRYINPNAAMGYATYKAQVDSMQAMQNQRYSAAVDPSQYTTADEAYQLRSWYHDRPYQNNWNVGLGWNFWGPSISVGYGRGFNNRWGWNNGWNDPFWNTGWGWNNRWGWNNGWNDPFWNSGWGWNNGWNDPFCNTGWGWYDPYWNNGWGWGWNRPWGWNNGYWNDNRTAQPSGNQPIQMVRPGVGNNTPPASNDGRSNPAPGTISSPGGRANSQFVAPNTPANNGTPAAPNNSSAPYYPSGGGRAASLENRNGRVIYTPPTQPAQPPAGLPSAPANRGNEIFNGGGRQNTPPPANRAPSTPEYRSFPNNSPSGGRSGSVPSGGGRSGSSGGSSTPSRRR
jgi:hypothetical protein